MESPVRITVHATISASVAKVWDFYIKPEHIINWNNASDDWHTPWATNDLRVGGNFVWRMEAKDKSVGFDFNGTYTDIELYQTIAYSIEGGRKVDITFAKVNNAAETQLTIVFEAETENPIELQRDGWQSILNNFKRYVESNNQFSI